MKVNGTIAAISSEPRNTKYGTRNVHYITVNGERYQLGFGKLEVKVGDNVTFEEGDKGYGKEVTKGSLVVVASGVAIPAGTVAASPAAAAAVADAPAPAAKGGGKTPTPFPIPALHGDRAIIRQNALTQAREVVMKSGLPYPVPASSGGVGAPDNDMVVNEIIRVARKFEAYSAGDLDMAEAKAEVKSGS